MKYLSRCHEMFLCNVYCESEIFNLPVSQVFFIVLCFTQKHIADAAGNGLSLIFITEIWGGGARVVVSTAAFHARARGSVPGLGGLKETRNVSSPSTCESQYCGEPP